MVSEPYVGARALDVTLLVDTTPEGAIVLRPAAVYPIEIYSDKRIQEFDATDRCEDSSSSRADPEAQVRRYFLDANVIFTAPAPVVTARLPVGGAAYHSRATLFDYLGVLYALAEDSRTRLAATRSHSVDRA